MPDQEYLAPRGSAELIHAGSFRRLLPVAPERLYETALDWRRLCHLHRDSVRSLACEASGSWGWRGVVTLANGRESLVELVLERRLHRWVTRTVSGHGAPAQFWTQVFPLAPRRLEIVVDFFLAPGAPANSGRTLAGRHARLYDRDVRMMVERQRQLDRRIDRSGSQTALDLGSRAALELPLTFELGGREFILAEVPGGAGADGLVAYPARCPHQLGPLAAGRRDGATVTCPWHGFQFDVRTGANLSGQPCRLSHLPVVRVGDDGRVRVTASH